ncbi:SDR family NAD(P)-dependent oxidoreductase [Saccharopolyspora tripterygii]
MTSRSVLITGGAQGIGAATADEFASRGWQVLVADLNEEDAAKRAKELNSRGGDECHFGFGCNVTSEAAVAKTFEQVSETTGGGLDALVSCAGILMREDAKTIDTAKWASQLDVHLTGAMLVARAAYALMLGRPGPSIVNIASVGSTFGLPGRVAYSTAKSGILGLTRTLAAEWGPDGIRVNAVAPGYVRTAMVQSGLDAGTLSQDALVSRTPLRRLADPGEIATAIAFLASQDAAFVHGEVLKVDGGLTIDGRF